MLDELLKQYTASHRCGGCSGSDRLADEVDPFCPNCGYLLDLHEDGCPDELEVRERWGR